MLHIQPKVQYVWNLPLPSPSQSQHRWVPSYRYGGVSHQLMDPECCFFLERSCDGAETTGVLGALLAVDSASIFIAVMASICPFWNIFTKLSWTFRVEIQGGYHWDFQTPPRIQSLVCGYRLLLWEIRILWYTYTSVYLWSHQWTYKKTKASN